MKIGSGVIDARRSSARLLDAPKRKPGKREENREEQLREYEAYQRKAFENVVLRWDRDRLETRLRELAFIEGEPHDLHFRRLRAERDAIEQELKKRGAR